MRTKQYSARQDGKEKWSEITILMALPCILRDIGDRLLNDTSNNSQITLFSFLLNLGLYFQLLNDVTSLCRVTTVTKYWLCPCHSSLVSNNFPVMALTSALAATASSRRIMPNGRFGCCGVISSWRRGDVTAVWRNRNHTGTHAVPNAGQASRRRPAGKTVCSEEILPLNLVEKKNYIHTHKYTRTHIYVRVFMFVCVCVCSDNNPNY